jgi:hypothetical protein
MTQTNMSYLDSGFNENLIRKGYSGVEDNGIDNSTLLAEIAAGGEIPTSEVTDSLVSAGITDTDKNVIVDMINDNLDTQSKEILGSFVFGTSGALAMNTDADNGLWISPTGILAKKAGVATVTITNAGDATFKGTIAAGSIISASINASLITTGVLNADLITAGTLTGRTVQTAAAGQRTRMTSAQGVQFMNGESQRGYMLLDGSDNMWIDADGAMVITANNAVHITFNDDGGGDGFQVINDSTGAFAIDDANDGIFAANVYAAGDFRPTGYCYGRHKSSDGTSGKTGTSTYGFVTAVESSRAKWREFTVRDGLITSVAGESGWG